MVALETWRSVPDLPLEASSLGRIRNRLTGCIYKPAYQTNGYCFVTLRIDEKRQSFRAHRLICAAFHGPAPVGLECDHINHQRDDNRPENLRWVRPEENKAHRRLARGERHGSSRLTDAMVREIRALLRNTTDTAIGAAFGVHRRTIGDIRNGVTWNV